MLKDTFEMIDLGLLHFSLGIQVLQLDDGIFNSQLKYALDLLKRFKMEDCRPCSTPYQQRFKLTKESSSAKVDATLYRQLVGRLIHLTRSILNIAFLVNLVFKGGCYNMCKCLDKCKPNLF
jgi:hypothetical protein